MPRKLRPRKKRPRGHTSPHVIQINELPNSTGLAALPPELLLEIVNHLPRFPIPCDYIGSPIKTAIHTRQATVMILVQICKALRQTLLHLAWEDIKLCSLYAEQGDTMVGRAWSRHSCELDEEEYCNFCERHIVFEIVFQLATVMACVPAYAAHVQTLSIFIPNFFGDNIAPRFARDLALLPNLKTLQLHYNRDDSALDSLIRNSFSKYRYENIQTLVIQPNDGSIAILKACLNVHHLHLTIRGPFNLWDVYPNIEKLTGVLPTPLSVSFRKAMPNLKHIQFRADGGSDAYVQAMDLTSHPKLEVIEIAVMKPGAQKEVEGLQKLADHIFTARPSIQRNSRRVEIRDFTQPG
ncbi:hypothetical protein BDN72DRAFT_849001 [Pluteus cervinus]|uniref:Uncharacterized protein n=1 Tax=Pluteus cervinus TaxID=181527 RepID=A0ACD3A985_9AGAR|nr:hypothetical protein BDN72DRAFT_849001 [Pluteus cervinus]